MGQLSNEIKVTLCAPYTADGVGAVNGPTIDMAGYEGVLFLADMDTTHAGNYISVQQGTTTSPTDALAGTKVTTTALGGTEEVVGVDVYRPQKRYVRCVAIRAGASTVLGGMWAIQYGPRTLPVDNTVAGSINVEQHQSPAEGAI